jgi:hypothetical protein
VHKDAGNLLLHQPCDKQRWSPPGNVLERETMENHNDKFIFAMYLMFLRAPGRETLPGECVDLGEIGQVREKDWERLTPYSPAKPSR